MVISGSMTSRRLHAERARPAPRFQSGFARRRHSHVQAIGAVVSIPEPVAN
jgi:hypothetical protein